MKENRAPAPHYWRRRPVRRLVPRDLLASVDPVLLPSPMEAGKAFYKGMYGVLGFDFVKTVYRTLMATAIAAVIAIPLGIVLGASERL